MVYVLMGVAGCGKTTVGKLLADKLKMAFHDADEFHPLENVRKMGQGIPLSDGDRLPWLATLSVKIEEWNNDSGAVLACSALKETHRRRLSGNNPEDILFIHLTGSRELIRKRLETRRGHYFSPELMESQFAILEAAVDCISVQIAATPDDIVKNISERLNIVVNHLDRSNGTSE